MDRGGLVPAILFATGQSQPFHPRHKKPWLVQDVRLSSSLGSFILELAVPNMLPNPLLLWHLEKCGRQESE